MPFFGRIIGAFDITPQMKSANSILSCLSSDKVIPAKSGFKNSFWKDSEKPFSVNPMSIGFLEFISLTSSLFLFLILHLRSLNALNGLMLVALPISVDGAEKTSPISLTFCFEGVNRIEDGCIL